MSVCKEEFACIYRHGFVRVACATPAVTLSEPAACAEEILALVRQSHDSSHRLVVFPELCLGGYTNADLFFQDTFTQACLAAIAYLEEKSRTLDPVFIAGAPLETDGALYNTAIVIHRGNILGIVPKTFLPAHGEFYEKRHFAGGGYCRDRMIRLNGKDIPFGTDLVFEAADMDGFSFHVEICEDLWAPVQPSALGALGGARILANLSASNITTHKASYRDALCRVQSERCRAACLYAAAGTGESTTDMVFDGHSVIYENGTRLACSGRFNSSSCLISADIDLKLLGQERIRNTAFADCARLYGKECRRISFMASPPRKGDIGYQRPAGRFPYIPGTPSACDEIYDIQARGLAQRLKGSGHGRIVIGISGGLDSAHALLVACRAFDRLGIPRTEILAYTMPAFGTGARTKSDARALMPALGVTANEIDISPVSTQILKDIGHPGAHGKKCHDTTFENVQAGARAATLFRLANRNNALVLGTGDLSELALGWCTYGVGDHMSHYNVNGAVPKTLIRHLVRHVAGTGEFGPDAAKVLLSVLDTPVSPELVPGDGTGSAQLTEDTIGPYILQDYNLYHILRYGFRPSRVAFMAWRAWSHPDTQAWPDCIPEQQRKLYDFATVRKWLSVFLHRFFAVSQYKRSALPDGPKVCAGLSLSPRADWRAPSDGSARAWLDELERNTPDDLQTETAGHD